MGQSKACKDLDGQCDLGDVWLNLGQFAHQKSGMYYNGLSHEKATKSTTNGIHSELHFYQPCEDSSTEHVLDWCERGGIVGRGILVDWVSQIAKLRVGNDPI